MTQKSLFNPDETYTKLGSCLYVEISDFAKNLMKNKYKGFVTRDVATIAVDAFGMQAVIIRTKRNLIKIQHSVDKEIKGE